MKSPSAGQKITTTDAVASIFEEMQRARREHRSFASWHEAVKVIEEELEEFWDSVKANEPDIAELAQVAACCILAITELSHTIGE